MVGWVWLMAPDDGGSTLVHTRDGDDISIYELTTCFGRIDSVCEVCGGLSSQTNSFNCWSMTQQSPFKLP